jgi:hypothetical protein
MATDPREPYGRIVHGVRLAFNADLPHPRGVLPWEEREAGQQEMDMRIGAAVAAAERERAEAELAGVREALKRHAHAFTDPKGAVLCGGCLRPAPCPDAGLTGVA